MTNVVSLERHRRKRAGLKPVIPLLGSSSSALAVLTLALEHSEPELRESMLAKLIGGTYADMLFTIITNFEVRERAKLA